MVATNVHETYEYVRLSRFAH